MWIIPLFCNALIALITIFGVRYFLNIFRYPVYFSFPLIVAVFMPLSVIYLLPTDYVLHNCKVISSWLKVSDEVILYLWKINYWVTFLLTWLVLPVLQEFFKSGHFKKKSKFLDALKKNLKFQLMILLVSIFGAIYLMLEVGLSLGHMKSMIIALSHIYSLVLALWLMAHGLTSIPRDMWIGGSIIKDLNFHYLKVPKLVDNLEDTRITFKESVLQVLAFKKNYGDALNDSIMLRDWILKLYNQIPLDIRENMELHYSLESGQPMSKNKLTESFLISVTSNFNNSFSKLKAYEAEFESLFRKITYLEDVLNCSTSDDLSERKLLKIRFENKSSFLSPRYRFYYAYYVKPLLNRAISIVLFLASFIIIESEFFHSTRISLANSIVFSTFSQKGNWNQFILSFLTFTYMWYSSMNSLTQLKVFNMYHLVRYDSSPESACFYATYIARLTIPLSYNFITLMISRDCVFEKWFGQSIHLTGLFNSMNNWLPRLVIVPVLLATFNIYEKLKVRLGISGFYNDWTTFDDNLDEEDSLDPTLDGMKKKQDLIIVEAKRIISRESLKRTAGSINSSDHIRSFNLSNAANLNYEHNRMAFNNSLFTQNETVSNSEAPGVPYYDEPESSGVLAKIGNVFDSIKNRVAGVSNSNVNNYTDEPFELGSDDENLII